MIEYEYTVIPENMCAGLYMKYKKTGQTRFRGILLYSPYYKEPYFTTDTVTYTSWNHALDIKIHEKHLQPMKNDA